MPIQPVMPSTKTTNNKLGSQSATSARRSTRRGIAKAASVMAMSDRSIMPPAMAAVTPTAIPSTVDTATDTNPTASEIRAPYMSRARMSRPNRSVPIQ